LGKALRTGYQDLLYERKKLIVILSALLLLAIVVASLGFYNTPWLFAGSTIADKPILTLDPNAKVPGYIHDIESHFLGFVFRVFSGRFSE
jgi:hypothetical protein